MLNTIRAIAAGLYTPACVVSALLLVTVALEGRQGPPPDVNSVRAIRAAKSGIEIEFHSNREFPVRSEVTILKVGDREFTRSRYPDDGRLDTLIFIITPEEFEELMDGADVTIKYGRHDPGRRWNFGKLNKALLRR